MSARSQRLLIAAALVLAFGAILAPPDRPDEGVSTYGTNPEGHAALFELLSKLDRTHGRSLRGVAQLPPDEVVWWIEPNGVCNSRIALFGGVDILDSDAVVWRAAGWVRRGGTAVVSLEPEGTEQASCDAIAGTPVPGRVETAGRLVRSVDAFAAEPRELELAHLRVFGERGDFDVVAEVEGKPLILERAEGEGRLVLISDSGFLRNDALGGKDAALLAVDLVRRYGPPFFDEREHGFVAETSALRYVAASSAWPVFAGVALFGLLVVWRGHALPARATPEYAPATPTLETFVRSLAGLYERSKDHDEIYERYRELQRSRVRRHFGLPPDLSAEAFAERLGREVARSGSRSRASGAGASLSLLSGRAAPIRSADDLRTRTAELDRAVEELIS